MSEQRCRNCGQLFDPLLNPTSMGFGTNTSGFHCSYHPDAPVLEPDHPSPGASHGYADIYRFPCCGQLAMGGEVNNRSVPPRRSPGCKVGPHVEDKSASWGTGPSYEFDVFLSFNSEDEPQARQVYDQLTREHLRVFFSRESIPQLAEADYMNAIHEALDQAHHLIVVTGSPANTTRGWVRSEWSMFLNEIRSGRKKGNIVVVLAEGAKIQDLPIALRAVQCVQLSPRGFEELKKFLC